MSIDYMNRKVGKPRSMTCTNCGRKRVPFGRLMLCPRCDEPALLVMKRNGKDGAA